MAYDSLTAMLTDIAGAIREKEESADAIPAEEFAERIRALSTGASDPGNVWTVTKDGTWTAPASGRYELELHGGGGGGGTPRSVGSGRYMAGGGGGGSGELFTGVTLEEGTRFTVVIGKGGAAETAGGATSFGEYSVEGGGRASSASAGGASGSLAESGVPGALISAEGVSEGGAGGSGGASFGGYGTGGQGGSAVVDAAGKGSVTAAGPGADGAVIITYLGE